MGSPHACAAGDVGRGELAKRAGKDEERGEWCYARLPSEVDVEAWEDS